MSGIALFVPSDEMFEQAGEILKEKDNHVTILKKIRTEDAVTEAQRAISEGVNIIIARGRQAAEIRRHTNVAVAEIVMTAQELGLLVARAKSIVEKECPRIGIFGWGDMLSDTTYFNQLYHVDLKRYILKDLNEWRNTIEGAGNDELDIIIGGQAALDGAYQMGIPGLYISSTGEAIRVALKNAESLYYMAEIEQHNYAQFSTILDSAFNGIIKVSVAGKILVINRAMEQILGCNSEECIGKPVIRFLNGLDGNALNQILEGKTDNYSTFLTLQDQSVVVSAEPIVVGNRIDGAIISCNRLKRLDMNDKDVMKEQYLRGYVAYGTFEDISKNLKDMRRVVELAKLYAQSSSPMLIEAISGPELEAITQGIHNYSMRKNGPFIMINMAGLSQDQQMRTLFGSQGDGHGEPEPGALAEASHGTLVIQSIDKLTLPTQYNLARVMRTKRLMRGSRIEDTQMIDTRIIACTAKNLTELRRGFQFRSDLYFTLKSLRLKIPNLKDRREDVEYLLHLFTRKYMEQYSRYHVMTAGAKKALLEYPWEGNSIQLEAFCERMILTVGKRTITEEYVRDLLDELYHRDTSIYAVTLEEEERMPEWSSDEAAENPERVLIKAVLKKYNGNRTLSARELNISTTTLWRKMKKLEIDEK
ncbi:sigma 54-interacting transcriptional regulator [Clostridium sp. Marseille-P2415]|uniref:sigma 54-interacting transcriptional regulator n=1 Tax=Clostridium sp. Marseille-P2415 TaxID=1805471 RepID=UPI0009885403|nr:PrpR N-terminal domain-containing protein [Clostridium sp. Marseille-P2415]